MADKQFELEEIRHKNKLKELEYERETRNQLLDKELDFQAKLHGLRAPQQYLQQPHPQQYPQQPHPQQYPPQQLQVPPLDPNIQASEDKYNRGPNVK